MKKSDRSYHLTSLIDLPGFGIVIPNYGYLLYILYLLSYIIDQIQVVFLSVADLMQSLFLTF